MRVGLHEVSGSMSLLAPSATTTHPSLRRVQVLPAYWMRAIGRKENGSHRLTRYNSFIPVPCGAQQVVCLGPLCHQLLRHLDGIAEPGMGDGTHRGYQWAHMLEVPVLVFLLGTPQNAFALPVPRAWLNGYLVLLD